MCSLPAGGTRELEAVGDLELPGGTAGNIPFMRWIFVPCTRKCSAEA